MAINTTSAKCKDPGFGFQISSLTSIRNMRDVQNKKYSDKIDKN